MLDIELSSENTNSKKKKGIPKSFLLFQKMSLQCATPDSIALTAMDLEVLHSWAWWKDEELCILLIAMGSFPC